MLAVLVFLPTIVSLLVIAILTVVIGFIAYRMDNYLLTVFSAAFLVRLALVVVDSIIGFLPTIPISSGHNQRAVELVIGWSNGQFFAVLGDVTSMRLLMAHLLAPFYVILGYSPLSGRIGVAFFSLFVGYFVFQFARVVVNRRTAVVAVFVVLFWPTVLARSIVIQREIIVAAALLAFLWATVQWLDSITLPSLVIAALAVVSIFALRIENLFLVAAMIGFISLVKSRNKPYYIAGIALLVTPFLVYFVLNFSQFTGHGNTLSPAALDAFAHGRAHGDAAYLVNLHYETWLDVILYAPIKALYFLYTPFPWQIRGITELIVGTSALALLAATVFVRRGIGLLRDRPFYLGLLLSYLMTGIVTYAIIEMNYGAAVRRRIQFIPILLLLAVIGFSNVELEVRWQKE